MQSSHHPHLQVVQAGEVITLTLDRMDQDNRMSNGMIEALTAALGDVAASCRLIVLRANGPDFCLGRDMPPPPVGSNTTAEQVLRDDAAPVLALFDAVLSCPVPLLCAVQGRAWGIGLVLAAMADISVASDDVSFRLRELERGIPPCLAMAPLVDRIPTLALSHLVLTAGQVDASLALSWGLIGEQCARPQLDERVHQLSERVLGFPNAAVLAVKRYLAHAPRYQVKAAASQGAQLLAQVLAAR